MDIQRGMPGRAMKRSSHLVRQPARAGALGALGLALLLGAPSAGAQSSRAQARVPEAEGYTLVYALDLPLSARYNLEGVDYAIDRSHELQGPFDRVAYYLELEGAAGELEWVYASMDAFSADPSQIGIPARDTGARFQQPVRALHVASNQPGIAQGDFEQGGNVELWPDDYAADNAATVPGASETLYDWGDRPTGSGDYGSFQVHNHAAGQTLLAVNRWGDSGGTPLDIGIGNAVDPAQPGGAQVDWTFRANAGDWSARRLEVLVRPGAAPAELRIRAPLPHAVYQRRDGGRAAIPVELLGASAEEQLEARAVALPGHRGLDSGWQPIPRDPSCTCFRGQLSLAGGWYGVELQLRGPGTREASQRVEPVGAGEVFITAGQSNSANHGSPALAPADPRVSAFDGQRWQPAADPQPIATGSGGSPWPVLGDQLAAALDLPIGFVSVGWGGTRVDQWLPGGSLFPRIENAARALEPGGARALLWHQGESDARAGTSTTDYAERLRSVIAASRGETGQPLPWGVARVSFLPANTADRMAAIIAGQEAVIASDADTFPGPATDAWVGAAYRWDGVHFGEAGLRAHAAGWATAIAAGLPELSATVEPGPPTATPTATPTASATPTPTPSATTDPVPPISPSPSPALWLPRLHR